MRREDVSNELEQDIHQIVIYTSICTLYALFCCAARERERERETPAVSPPSRLAARKRRWTTRVAAREELKEKRFRSTINFLRARSIFTSFFFSPVEELSKRRCPLGAGDDTQQTVIIALQQSITTRCATLRRAFLYRSTGAYYIGKESVNQVRLEKKKRELCAHTHTQQLSSREL